MGPRRSQLKAQLVFLLVPVTLLCWWRGYSLNQSALSSLYPDDGGTAGRGHIPEPTRAQSGGEPDDLVIGDAMDNVFSFVHISDLHVSRFFRRGASGHFLHFLSSALPLINPAFVTATGDLTDAKSKSKLHSLQYRVEWQLYAEALRIAGAVNRTSDFWLDMRGNHDTFNVASWESDENLWKTYGVLKSKGYTYDLNFSFGKYRFVGLDACPHKGPCRPFNFFSYVNSEDMDNLENALKKDANHTFLLAHYPVGNIHFGMSSNGASFDELSHRVSLFMCGHLHKLFLGWWSFERMRHFCPCSAYRRKLGLGRQLYAHKPTNFLELELADLKEHGAYRIVTVDHDMIAFRDVALPLPILPAWHNYTEWDPVKAELVLPPAIPSPPIIQVTNPKDGRFVLLHHEPLGRILKSTHIRILIWSSSKVEAVRMSIDGRRLESIPVDRSFVRRRPVVGALRMGVTDSDWEKDVERVPLWTVAWQPQQYDDGREHVLIVEATDADGREARLDVPFRVDGKLLPLHGGPGEWIISTDFNKLFRKMFLVSYLVVTLGFLLIPKLHVTWLISSGRYQAWKAAKAAALISLDARSLQTSVVSSPVRKAWYKLQHFLTANVLRFCLLAAVPEAFYGLMAFCLYIVVGPWIAGDFVPSAGTAGWGTMYLYGLYIDGKWIPLTDSWTYIAFAVAYDLGLLVAYLSFRATPSELVYCRMNPRRARTLHTRWYVKAAAAGVFLYVLSGSLLMGAFYGPWAAVLSAKFWLWCYGGWLIWRVGPAGESDTAGKRRPSGAELSKSAAEGAIALAGALAAESEEFGAEQVAPATDDSAGESGTGGAAARLRGLKGKLQE